MDHKCFMGMAQILLEDLDLSATVSGWYKLFPTSSLADPSIGPLTRRLSQSSLESATSPSCTQTPRIHTHTHARARQSHAHTGARTVYTRRLCKCKARQAYIHKAMHPCRKTHLTYTQIPDPSHTDTHSQHAAIVFTGISSRLSVHTLTHRSVFTGKTISRSKTGEGVIYLNMQHFSTHLFPTSHTTKTRIHRVFCSPRFSVAQLIPGHILMPVSKLSMPN